MKIGNSYQNPYQMYKDRLEILKRLPSDPIGKQIGVSPLSEPGGGYCPSNFSGNFGDYGGVFTFNFSSDNQGLGVSWCHRDNSSI